MKQAISIEEHADIASRIDRIQREVVALLREIAGRMPKKDTQCLHTMYGLIDTLKSKLENKLLREHPNLGNEWTRLYYGSAEDVKELLESIQRESHEPPDWGCVD